MSARASMNLLTKVNEFIKNNNLILRGDKIVVGVSGGPDSLCLLHILNCLKIAIIEILGIMD